MFATTFVLACFGSAWLYLHTGTRQTGLLRASLDEQKQIQGRTGQMSQKPEKMPRTS